MDNRLIEIARKTQYQAVTSRLGNKPNAETILTVFSDAQTVTSRFMNAILEQAAPPACEMGCHFCCYLMATVSAPEALAIADRIRHSFSGTELRHLKQKISQSLKRTKKLNSFGRIRAGVACPLLSDKGLCSIYEFRPLDCMTYHSQDKAACEQKLQQPERSHPVNSELRAIGIGVKAGLGQGIARAQLEQPALRYELIEAISIALNDPKALKKYLAGRNVFMPAAIITDRDAGIGYKIKYAPARLKEEAKRVLALEGSSETDSRPE